MSSLDVYISPSHYCLEPYIYTILVEPPNVPLKLETMAPTDVIPNLPVSPGPQTPPSSPNLPPHKQALHSKQVQLLVDLLKAA